MQRIDGQPVYSATDLVGFLYCRHLTALERAAMAGLVKRPMRADPELDRIVKRGEQHEQRFLADLHALRLSVTEIVPDETIGDYGAKLRDRAARTREALARGDEVVYQATFFDGSWLGYADFVRRVETPSALGDWNYEVWDTKLARGAKASAVLQLSLYTELIGAIQGVEPAAMHIALGGSAREVDHLRVADYAAYFRLVRSQFLETVGTGERVFHRRRARIRSNTATCAGGRRSASHGAGRRTTCRSSPASPPGSAAASDVHRRLRQSSRVRNRCACSAARPDRCGWRTPSRSCSSTPVAWRPASRQSSQSRTLRHTDDE